MEWQSTLPGALDGLRGGILVVEAEPGHARTDALRAWAANLGDAGHEALLLRCDYRDGGIWAGADEWVRGLLPALEREAPELTERHGIELAVLLSGRTHPALQTLTDRASGSESVRNYALDRAYRVAHGVVDLVDAWYSHAPPAPRAIVCEGYDRASALCRRFFRALVRRRGESLGITLVVVGAPGSAGQMRADFADDVPAAAVRLHVPADPAGRSPDMAEFGRMLEEGVRKGHFLPEERFPDLLRYWEEAGGPAAALPWMAYALGRYNHYGYYEDALLFVEPVLAGIDRIPAFQDFLTRWNVVGAIFNCLNAVGQVERAARVVREEGVAKITDPLDRARASYVVAIGHARFLPVRDFAEAERWLDNGLAELERVDPDDENREFLTVFLGNARALIRSRQGKPAEAIELCATGYQRMTRKLGGNKHRLHRSVLLYNIAQVYAATREHERAVEYFTAAMEMDPNYSEYHNERGNVFLAMDRFEDAIRDYREAIRLSAPYCEVWSNLGQCFRKMGRPQDAVAAYSRALDLDPDFEIARVGRAQMLSALGRKDEARADYEAALARNPAQAQVLANLAVLHYQGGRVAEALDGLTRAVELEPETAPFYRNRAVALEELGRPDEAARDLKTYLSLAADAHDRAAVEEKIGVLSGALALV
jgi:tetratricopeptide (TPR) repeat protein